MLLELKLNVLKKNRLVSNYLASKFKFIRNFREKRFCESWDRAAVNLKERPPRPIVRSLVIFPCDPQSINGSVGDEAMIRATIDHFRTVCPELRISVFCYPGAAVEIVRKQGWTALIIPPFALFPEAVASIFSNGDYDAFIGIGADTLDGYYGDVVPRKLIAAADLAARIGISSSILGFSFNRAPAAELCLCFARLDTRVVLNVRDEVSLARFQRFTSKSARLVADAAFTIKPGDIKHRIPLWVQDQKSAGRRIIGVNLHALLACKSKNISVHLLADRLAEAIIKTSKDEPLAWLLIPHDYRNSSYLSDANCLHIIEKRLAGYPHIQCQHLDGEHSASILKAIAGLLDGLITGRMHLAIAALGSAVPSLVISYQDKFEGMLRHFNLPSWVLLTPEDFVSIAELDTRLRKFFGSLSDMSSHIKEKLPGVVLLAEKNFSLAEPKVAPDDSSK